MQERQHQIIQWAKSIAQQAPVILDTETTGLDGEICQIAIVSFDGEVLLDQLVKPMLEIPTDATRIHGITNAMVLTQPTWNYVRTEVLDLVRDRDVLIYNAAFDTRMLYNSDRRVGFDGIWISTARFHCAMERYAEYNGDWNDYRGNYRWVKLTDACRQCGIPDPDAPAHSALGDCLRTLALVKYLAARG